MKCGIRFCGGCNPRFDRRNAVEEIKSDLNEISFHNAVDGDNYDSLLVIGGCPSCCASYDQFNVNGEVVKMWDEEHIPAVKEKLSQK